MNRAAARFYGRTTNTKLSAWWSAHDHGFAPTFFVEPHHDAALHEREVEARLKVRDRPDVGLRDPVQIDQLAPGVLVGEAATHADESQPGEGAVSSDRTAR